MIAMSVATLVCLPSSATVTAENSVWAKSDSKVAPENSTSK